MMAEYFTDLNYSLSNEDTSVERQLLNRINKNSKSVFTICGAGSRVLPLLGSDVSLIKIVDMSDQQLQLLRLRLATAKALSYENFLAFWGYEKTKISRSEVINSIGLNKLDAEFWLKNERHWKDGFLFTGKWESYLRKLGVMFRLLFRANFETLFECKNLDERIKWYAENFPIKRLNLFLKIFANPVFFNLFLYKGKFAKSNEDFSQFLMRVFKIILIEKDPKKSFFAQMLFLGDLKYSEGWPLEAQKNAFESAKQFNGKIEIIKGDLIEELTNKQKFDFLSLSDVASYLDVNQLSNLEKSMMDSLNSGGISVIRSFRRHPEFSAYQNLNRQPKLEEWATSVDSIGVYKFHIFSHN